MKNKPLIIIVFTLLGLIVGYLLFAKIGDSYLSLKTLFNFSGGGLGDFGRSISGIKSMQQNIALSGVGGLVLGIIYIYLKRK